MGADGERRIAAGPLFLLGAGLFLLGLVRRRLVPLVAGGAAMWLDRESLLTGLRGDAAGTEPAGAPTEDVPPAATD